ncbi:MAG: hypothetical protein NVSMB64_26870 [Candidatus Velthaea sp.]
MTGHSAAAQHLAEMDARYESHLGALRDRASVAKAAVHSGVVSLQAALPAAKLEVEAPPPYIAPPPNPYAAHALIPDDPITAHGGLRDAPTLESFAAIDDGIPLWQD